MISNDVSTTLNYLNTLLDSNIEISYVNLNKILSNENIKVSKTILHEKKDDAVTLKTISDDTKGGVVVTLNAPSWIKMLPSFYHENSFLQRFLFGFQVSDLEYQNIIDNIENQFNPSNTDFVDWLSTWAGVKFAQEVNDKAKRRILHNIIRLYKIRGTKLYFLELLSYLTDVPIRIEDTQDTQHLHGSLYKRTSKEITPKFTIYIDKKLSEDSYEEKNLLQIVHDVVDAEKPINVEFHIEYPFKEDKIEQRKLDVINMDYENYYDYDNTRSDR